MTKILCMPLWSKILLIFIIIYSLKHVICDFLQQEHIAIIQGGENLTKMHY